MAMRDATSPAKAALRVFVDVPLRAGQTLTLPAGASRHVQVLRAQPGGAVMLFNGSAALEWPARIVHMGRSSVDVQLGDAVAVDRELDVAVTLALGVPANDRMDGLIEKAGELGAAAIQPLLCERSVVRLGEARAEAKQRHWRGVAAAASEQCGRTRVTEVRPVRSLQAWLGEAGSAASPGTDFGARRIVLSLGAAAGAPAEALADRLRAVVVLSGPEGGLTAAEERAAVESGFMAVGLGTRVLRADTAPLAILAWIALQRAGAEP